MGDLLAVRQAPAASVKTGGHLAMRLKKIEFRSWNRVEKVRRTAVETTFD